MKMEQIPTPIAIKLDGIHTGEVKEVLIDQPLSLLVMLINRDTVFETMYCCDGLDENQMPYIAFKYDHRLHSVLNFVFDRMCEYKGSIRTEIHVKYLRDRKLKHKAIVIRGLVGKATIPKLHIEDKINYLNILKDALKEFLLILQYNIQYCTEHLDTYRKVRLIITDSDYGKRLN